MLVTDDWGILRWVSPDITDYISTLVQVMACCRRQAPNKPIHEAPHESIAWSNFHPDFWRNKAPLGHNKKNAVSKAM